MSDVKANPRPDRTQQTVDVLVETPKGSRCKYAFDSKSRAFRLKHVLPTGSVFPYDFGCIPKTLGDDGDPLDVLLLFDASTFPGCLLAARLIGVIEAEQSEDGETIRNDRLVAVAEEARDFSDLKSLKQINEHLLQEIEHFFISYNEIRGKTFKVLATKGPRTAHRLYKAARRLARQKK